MNYLLQRCSNTTQTLRWFNGYYVVRCCKSSVLSA